MKENAAANFWSKIALQIGIVVITVVVLSVGGWKGYKVWQVNSLIRHARILKRMTISQR